MDKDTLVHSIQILETQNENLQSMVERLESGVKDNIHYREECVLRLDTIEKLQAQLARCVVELKNAGCWLDSLNELPKIVHLDAEVLGWVDAWIKAKDTDMKQKDFSDYLYDIEVAVRARMEASNDNI